MRQQIRVRLHRCMHSLFRDKKKEIPSILVAKRPPNQGEKEERGAVPLACNSVKHERIDVLVKGPGGPGNARTEALL